MLPVSSVKKNTEDRNMGTDKMKLSSKISDGLWRVAPESAKKKRFTETGETFCVI